MFNKGDRVVAIDDSLRFDSGEELVKGMEYIIADTKIVKGIQGVRVRAGNAEWWEASLFRRADASDEQPMLPFTDLEPLRQHYMGAVT
jgi:hypothetical protein